MDKLLRFLGNEARIKKLINKEAEKRIAG